MLVVMDEQRLYRTLLQHALKIFTLGIEPTQIKALTKEVVKDIFDPSLDTFQVDYGNDGSPRFLPADRENHRNRIEQKKNHRRPSRHCMDCDQIFFSDEEDYYQIEMHGRCCNCKKGQDDLEEEERIRKLDERWEAMQSFFIREAKSE